MPKLKMSVVENPVEHQILVVDNRNGTIKAVPEWKIKSYEIQDNLLTITMMERKVKGRKTVDVTMEINGKFAAQTINGKGDIKVTLRNQTADQVEVLPSEDMDYAKAV